MLFTGCGEENDLSAPQILPIQSQEVRVNQQLSVNISVDNPSGLALSYGFSSDSLQDLSQHAIISGDARGGVFQFSPLVSHVGEHEVSLSITSSEGSHSQAFVVAIIPASSAAPIFLQPTPGGGGVFDLNRDPCVRFDLEVRDDDTADVVIRERGEHPAGSMLTASSDKRSTFGWCPTDEQLATARSWRVSFEADDRDHDPVGLTYTITLRRAAALSCPGEPPIVTVESPADGGEVGGAGGYRVEIFVEDDTVTSDAPLLLYSTKEPVDATAPDLSVFSALSFEPAGGAGRWVATIPPFDLAEGEERAVYYLVSATDDDDANGIECDHTTETTLRTLMAVSAGAEKAQQCELCATNEGCERGLVCVQSDSGQHCLSFCEVGGAACGSGVCSLSTDVAGAEVGACGDVSAVCGSAECVDDGFEENDSASEPATLPEGGGDMMLCPGDRDFFSASTIEQSRVTVSVSDLGDGLPLELDLYTSDGELRCYNAATGSAHEISLCLYPGESLTASVYSFDASATGSYGLNIQKGPGDLCCSNDLFEPDNSFATARSLAGTGEFEGTLCPCDADYIDFEVTSEATIEVSLLFDQNTAVEAALYGPNGEWIDSQTSTGEGDELEFTLPNATPGWYTLGMYGLGQSGSDYLGMLSLIDCETTLDCGTQNVCNGGTCVSDLCADPFDCPVNHVCAHLSTQSSFSACAMGCAANSECREGEACKWLEEGRGCGVRGTAQNGDACTGYEDCGGQRTCLDWPGGYCARMHCTSNADCAEPGVFCGDVNDVQQCVKLCDGTAGSCREGEGYVCTDVLDMSAEIQLGCIPL